MTINDNNNNNGVAAVAAPPSTKKKYKKREPIFESKFHFSDSNMVRVQFNNLKS